MGVTLNGAGRLDVGGRDTLAQQKTTNMRASIFILSLLASPLIEGANKDIPQAVIDALVSYFPNHKPNTDYIVLGDLTKDEIPEIATLLGAPQYNEYKEEDADIKIAVLKGEADNAYAILSLSPALPRDPRLTYFLRIEKRSLYLLAGGSTFSNTYHFELRGNDFVLIGEESSSFGPEAEAPYTNKSFNYLTGEVVFSEERNTKRKAKKCRFAASRLIKLAEFNLSDEFFRTQPVRMYGCPRR